MHLTLKLKNTEEDRTFIIGCNAVNIVPNGSGYHVKVTKEDDAVQDFHVGGPEFNIGYVENFNGATTHIIKPRGTK